MKRKEPKFYFVLEDPGWISLEAYSLEEAKKIVKRVEGRFKVITIYFNDWSAHYIPLTVIEFWQKLKVFERFLK